MSRQKVSLIVQAALCACVAGWLACSAISLYVNGVADQAGGDLFNYIYTREKVGARLAPMLPLIFAGLGMTVSGWILDLKDEDAFKPVQDPEIIRNLTCARVQTPTEAMTAERSRQRKLLFGGFIGFALCMIPIAIYILNGSHFDRPRDTESDLFALLKVFAPFTVAGIACLAVTSVLRQKSMARETEAARAQAEVEKAAGVKTTPAPIPVKAVRQDGGRPVLILRVILLVAAVSFIVLGVFNGGLEDVLTKANAICMECVGLG